MIDIFMEFHKMGGLTMFAISFFIVLAIFLLAIQNVAYLTGKGINTDSFVYVILVLIFAMGVIGAVLSFGQMAEVLVIARSMKDAGMDTFPMVISGYEISTVPLIYSVASTALIIFILGLSKSVRETVSSEK